MARPTARVLAVLELLQTHRRMTGAQLASRLAVDGRTVRRYVALLQDIGIPLTAERGRDGAYMLVAGFKLPPMMFTDDEALALSVGPSGRARARSRLRGRGRLVRAGEARARDAGRPQTPGPCGGRDRDARAVAPDRSGRQRGARGPHRRRAVARPGPPALSPAHGRGHRARLRRVRPRVPQRPLVRGRLVPPAARAALVPPRPGRGRAAPAGVVRAAGALRRARAPDHVDRAPAAGSRRGGRARDREELAPVDAGVVLHAQADDLDWLARELARLPFAFRVRTPRALRTAVAALARRLARQAGGSKGSR